jgi:predicted RNA binding protein YcfA (HicA-like mRNA interferase family)
VSKLPAVKPTRVIKALQRHGYYIHHVRGSYYFLRKSDRNVVIPYHNLDLKPGTLRSIIEQSGLTVEEFLDLL